MPLYGLVGKKLGHSFSKAWFNAKFEREHLTGFYYENFELPDLENHFVELININQPAGLNITIPYKLTVIPYVDQLDATAQSIGSINTIAFTSEKSIGFNTDYTGFKFALLKQLKSMHSSALILGTGASARTVAFVLAELGIHYQFVSSKKRSEGVLLYEDLTLEIIRQHLLIVNTTPLGMFPDITHQPDLPYEAISKYHFLYDLIYNPTETLFLKSGKKTGAATSNGYEMLIKQAEESWRIWSSFR